MPAKVLPTPADFAEFRRKMCDGLKFRTLYGSEVHKELWRLGAKSPRPRSGREVGFLFYANGLTVFVWTTWLAEEARARKDDAGWVLIKNGSDPEYFSHPVHRTRSFLVTLFRYAWVNHKRALNRPICLKCREFMRITRGRGLKARYWRCNPCYAGAKTLEERRKFCVDWDYGLCEQELCWVRALRRARAKKRAAYMKKRLAEGHAPTPAVVRRHAWKRNAFPTL